MKVFGVYPFTFDTCASDLKYFKTPIPLGDVKVPVHLIHGDCDVDVPYEQSVQAHKAIEGSIFITAKGGTHTTNFHEDWKEHIA